MALPQPPHEPWATWLRAKGLIGPDGQPSWRSLSTAITRLPDPQATPTADTVRRIAQGTNRNPRAENLQVIARVLGLPLERITATLKVKPINDAPWEPPAEISRLGNRQRQAISDLIRALAEAQPKVSEVTPTVRPRPVRAVPDLPRAAKTRDPSAPKRGAQEEGST